MNKTLRSDRDRRAALTSVIHDLHQRRWCEGTGGNFSVVFNRNPLQLLMAPSGVDKGLVEPEQLLLVDASGTVIDGDGRSSAETDLHLCIVNQTGAGAVLHTHSPIATVLSKQHEAHGGIEISGWEMLKGLEGINTHEASINIPVISNSQSMQVLVEAITPKLKSSPHGFLVAGHGLYTWGDNLEQAKRHIEILEYLLEINALSTHLTSK